MLTGPMALRAADTATKIEFVDPLGASSLAQAGHDLSPLGMFETADSVVQTVILILLLASLITWTIGIAKWRELKGERHRLRTAAAKLNRAPSLSTVGEIGYAPLSDMLVSAEDEIALSDETGPLDPSGIKDRITLRLERLAAAVRRRAGRGIGLLAIVSSTAPFVGLFGTVWGIMNSFIGIAHAHTTNLAVVAPGIAEALLTTAGGLVAAIPAGIMYNLFARALSVYAGELDDAAAAILCLAARDVDRTDGRS